MIIFFKEQGIIHLLKVRYSIGRVGKIVDEL
jgi:hypothetical protein